MTDVFTAAAILLAWIAFRFERYTSHKAAVGTAIGKLRAVKGALTAYEHDPAIRWGDLYFGTVYNEPTLRRRIVATRRIIRARRLDQVLVIPTEPLALLATASDDLISERTVAAANIALWRAGAFNQLVGIQTSFNAAHAVEIHDTATSPSRRQSLIRTAGRLSLLLHRSGIGVADDPDAEPSDAWYRELKEAINSNLDVLGLRRGARTWWTGDRRFLAFDFLVAGLLVAALVITAT